MGNPSLSRPRSGETSTSDILRKRTVVSGTNTFDTHSYVISSHTYILEC